jgi:deazaflavin-dependent oxidoreductase (nitroreductase family)
MSYLDAADRMWPVLHRLMRAHVAIYRATNGRIGHWFPGVPTMLLLDHVGAKSGTRRTSALAYVRDGDNVALIASKGGHPAHPAWFHNLMAHPDVSVQIGPERRAVHARLATPEERARIWPRAVASWRSFDAYKERTDREIPVVVLEPRV